MEKKKGQTGLIIGMVVIVLVVFSFFYFILAYDTVADNKVGVVVRFGEIKGTLNAGLHNTGMFADVYQYDKRIRKEEVQLTGGGSAVDKTGQAVYATINVNYKLKATPQNVKDMYSNVGTDEVIDDILNLDAIIREGFKQATVKYDALDILDKRQEVKELAKENIKRNFPTEYFDIVDIVITNIDFSDAFKQAIEQKKVAEQQAIKAEADLQRVIQEQKAEIEKFKADAEKIRLQSETLTGLTIQQKWIESWDGVLPKYMIVNDGMANQLLQLPVAE